MKIDWGRNGRYPRLTSSEIIMKRMNFVLFAVIALSLLTGCATTRSERVSWLARVFAPYMYVGDGDDFKLTDCDDACGLKYYTLAFIIARQDGRSRNTIYYPEPSWDGRIPIAQNFYHDQIDAIRQRGGDVIMSFGGEAGREIAIVETNVAVLEANYQSIIDRYHFAWLDFDIEGRNLENTAANERRNSALAELQRKNPGLIVSYTLPVDPRGISSDSQELLADAVKKGVNVHSANLMVMYFGREFVGKGKSEGQLGIESANKAHAQIQKIDPAIQIGLCPCLGRNGSRDEVFTLDDARTLKAFADKTPWVCSLSYWSINDDAARPRRRRNSENSSATNSAANAPQPWAFAKIFLPFTSR